jgi:hypothetical protein
MNYVPRSVSGNLGNEYKKVAKDFTTAEAKKFYVPYTRTIGRRRKRPTLI